MKSPHQIRVESFMRLAGQNLPDKITEPNAAVRLLRARLILEEALETVQALGVAVSLNTTQGLAGVYIAGLEFYSVGPFDLVNVVDGCCDIKVVTTGTLSACGIADERCQEIVDQANLRKFGPGGYKDHHGKWIKPPNFIPAQAELQLELQQQAMV